MTTKFRVEQKLCELFGAKNIEVCRQNCRTLYFLKNCGQHVGTWNPGDKTGIVFKDENTAIPIN